jgi:hypothetical protein
MHEIRDDDGEMPYRSGSVTFIRILSATQLDASNEVGVKREWLSDRKPLFAAWNGAHRADIFRVDRAAARKALA